MGTTRKVVLWVVATVTAMVFLVVTLATAFWISVGGTIYRGETVGVGTVLQIGLAVLSCVGLLYLIRMTVRAARTG